MDEKGKLNEKFFVTRLGMLSINITETALRLGGCGPQPLSLFSTFFKK